MQRLVLIQLCVFGFFLFSESALCHEQHHHESKKTQAPKAKRGGQVHHIAGHWIEIVLDKGKLRIYQQQTAKAVTYSAIVIYPAKSGVTPLKFLRGQGFWEASFAFYRQKRATVNLTAVWKNAQKKEQKTLLRLVFENPNSAK